MQCREGLKERFLGIHLGVLELGDVLSNALCTCNEAYKDDFRSRVSLHCDHVREHVCSFFRFVATF